MSQAGEGRDKDFSCHVSTRLSLYLTAYAQLPEVLLELDEQTKVLGRTPRTLVPGRPHAACVTSASYLNPTMTGLAGEHDR
jgi:hypothetical protein